MNALQKQFKLTPLSAWGRSYTPPRGIVDPTIDVKTPPVDQVNRMSVRFLQDAGGTDEGQSSVTG
ncbi:MAG TPA: hypothetical protein VKB88_46485 [Bryobacteraceae bacterium]|nr:hypothetical protein [Bryobacteraceae bacterium]